MNRVVGIDHISIRVSDLKTSKKFYGNLFKFLGFKVLDEYEDAIGWTNRKTRFWIGAADFHPRVLAKTAFFKILLYREDLHVYIPW